MYLIIRIFPVSLENFRDVQWDLLFCLENTLPIVGTRRGKNKLSPIAVGNVIQWERAGTHREASGSTPIDLDGSWTTSHTASETFVGKTSTLILKDENEETHEFQNFVAPVGSAPKPAEASTKSMVRLTVTQSDLSVCFAENFVSSLATTLRKYLFITR